MPDIKTAAMEKYKSHKKEKFKKRKRSRGPNNIARAIKKKKSQN